METDTERKTIRQIAEAVAPYLGEGWTFEPVPNRTGERMNDLENEWETERGQIVNGVHRLYFHNMYRDKDKIHISGEFPKMSDGEEIPKARRPYNNNGPWHSICVSHFKAPEQIAKDIKRRLLPDYMALMVEVLAQREEIDGQYNGRDSRAEAIAKILQVKPRGGIKRGDEVSCGTAYLDSAPSCEVRFAYSGEMDIHIRTRNLDLAKALAALVQAHWMDANRTKGKVSEADNG